MRLLCAVLLAAVTGAVSAADKPEDKAKEAAVAFLKAVKTKDADAVLKTTAAPFAYKDGDKVTVLKTADELKTWLKEKLPELKNADQVPTEVSAVHPFADVKDKIKDDEQRKAIEGIVGKDGFVAVVATPDGKQTPLLVRMAGGKAAVVGLGR
jgi:hypothetical protein